MQFNKKQVKISADEQVNLFSKQLNMVHWGSGLAFTI